jgi:hypothetical protein
MAGDVFVVTTAGIAFTDVIFCIFVYLLVVGVLDDLNGTMLITHSTLSYKVAQFN